MVDGTGEEGRGKYLETVITFDCFLSISAATRCAFCGHSDSTLDPGTCVIKNPSAAEICHREGHSLTHLINSLNSSAQPSSSSSSSMYSGINSTIQTVRNSVRMRYPASKMKSNFTMDTQTQPPILDLSSFRLCYIALICIC